jgi:phosphoglycolate phosphatase
MMKLIIFDLDQTLVDLGQLHNEVTHRLLKEFFGIEAWLTEVEHAGRSQRDGLRHLAELKGVPGPLFDSRVDRILDEFGNEFASRMPLDAAKHVLPGATDLLARLSAAGHILVLYTGDAPGVVRAVLEATGLGRYFTHRFSGTEVRRREDMVTLAIAAAVADTGRDFRDKDVVIIGDALRDVECGRTFNALTIGVATGYYTAAELAQAGADLTVPNLQESRLILDAIERT